MKNTVEDPQKLADKLSEDEKTQIKDALKVAQEWLDGHSDAEKEQYDEQLKELEGVCNPIISKIYQQSGGDQQQTQEDAHDDL